MVDDHVVEEETDHDEIGLWGFDFNLFDKDKKEVGRERSSNFPNLLMLIEIWTGDLMTKLKRMNQKGDEKNGKSMGIGNVQYRKFVIFQQCILEEHWLYCFSSYRWSWGI